MYEFLPGQLTPLPVIDRRLYYRHFFECFYYAQWQKAVRKTLEFSGLSNMTEEESARLVWWRAYLSQQRKEFFRFTNEN